MTDPKKVERLRALAGLPLTVLGAISICETDLFTNAWLCSVIGKQTAAISQAVASLIVMAFVERVDRYTYRLTPYGRQLVAPLAGILTRENRESLPPRHQLQLPTTLENRESPDRPQGEAPPESPADLGDSRKSRVAAPSSSSSNKELTDDIHQQLLKALEIGQVYANARAKLAQALLDEHGPQAVEHVLAWVAYAIRDGGKVGAVVGRALKDHLPTPDGFTPPATLPFEAQLSWAKRGGADLVPPTQELPDEPEPPAVIADTQTLWQQCLEQLRISWPGGVVDTWLAPAVLAEAEEPDTYRLLCQSRNHYDYTRTMLAQKVERELRRLTRRSITLTLVCPD